MAPGLASALPAPLSRPSGGLLGHCSSTRTSSPTVCASALRRPPSCSPALLPQRLQQQQQQAGPAARRAPAPGLSSSSSSGAPPRGSQQVCGSALGGDLSKFDETPGDGTGLQHVQKVVSLGMLFFCTTFNYTILQNLKDAIVVTTVGAEALPFLEAYGVLPASLAFFMFFKVVNRVLPERWVYAASLAPFLSYYALFAAVLYPLAGHLHPTHLLDGLRTALPQGLVGLAGMLVHWSYSLFFVVGELWGGVAISLLFWGLAAEVCSLRDASEVYPLLGIIANVGLILGGGWIKMVNSTLAGGSNTLAVQILVGTVLAMSGVLLSIKAFVHKKFLESPDGQANKEAAAAAKRAKQEAKEKGKKNASFMESLAVLRRSPKVCNLAIIVVSYFVSSKLFDFAWKAQMRVLCPSAAQYQTTLATVAQMTGITTMILMATSRFIFQRGGWNTAAMVTPLAMLLSGGVFFASSIAMDGGASFLSPELVGVLISVGGVSGLVGRVVSRAPKYSLFDPAREMVYITMSKNEKTESKAAVDLIGAYFGKSGASWIMQALVLYTGSLVTAMPALAMLHVAVGLTWISTTLALAKIMKTETQDQLRPKSNESKREKERAQGGGSGSSSDSDDNVTGEAIIYGGEWSEFSKYVSRTATVGVADSRARISAQAQRIHDRVTEQHLLRQKLETRNAESLILSGPGNCGKSTLLTQVVEDLQRDHPDAVILVLDGREGHLENPTTMLQTIQKQMASLPKAAKKALGLFQGFKFIASLAQPLQKLFGVDAQLELSLPKDVAEVGVPGFLQALSQRLEQGTQGTMPPLLIIDEANLMQLWANDDKTQGERITIMNFFINLTKFKEYCNILMATSEYSFVGWIKTELKSNTMDLMLGFFPEEDAKTFLQESLLQQPDPAVVNGIWDQVYEVCGGSPRLLRVFARSFGQLKGDVDAALGKVWKQPFEEVDRAVRKGGPGFSAEAYRKVASRMAGSSREQGAVPWPQLEDEVKDSVKDRQGQDALEAMLKANVICYREPSEMALDLNASVYVDGKFGRPVATAPSPAHLFAMRILKQEGRL